jgi:glyoxylase-like metal-dependent hydrolase (beta-lactamase superfamily II)
MSEDIPFDKELNLVPDAADEVLPGVRRVMANNPGPFTFKGTVSYIVGKGNVAIIDPGPDDPAHVGALLDAVRNETVTHIFVTHTHRDHSPAVPAIKAATGATIYAEGPHRAARPLHIGEHNPLDASADRDFMPDVRLKDGEVVEGDGWAIESITTPGHTANHMAYALNGKNVGKNILFAGDHVMAWATSIVAPPDGAMSDYMESLAKLAKRRSICPATGRRSPTPRASSVTTSCTARRAKPRSCTGSAKARATSRRSCARSTSVSIRA